MSLISAMGRARWLLSRLSRRVEHFAVLSCSVGMRASGGRGKTGRGARAESLGSGGRCVVLQGRFKALSAAAYAGGAGRWARGRREEGGRRGGGRAASCRLQRAPHQHAAGAAGPAVHPRARARARAPTRGAPAAALTYLPPPHPHPNEQPPPRFPGKAAAGGHKGCHSDFEVDTAFEVQNVVGPTAGRVGILYLSGEGEFTLVDEATGEARREQASRGVCLGGGCKGCGGARAAMRAAAGGALGFGRAAGRPRAACVWAGWHSVPERRGRVHSGGQGHRRGTPRTGESGRAGSGWGGGGGVGG